METNIQINEDWVILKKFLPSNWQEKAKEFGAITRKRKINNPETLLKAILIYLVEGRSFRTISAYLEEAGICDINDAALINRLRLSENWLHWMALELVQNLKCRPLPVSSSKKFDVKLVDGSVVKEPGIRGTKWRLHYDIRLSDLHCDTFLITKEQTGESLELFSIAKDDLIIGDRGFCRRNGIVHVLENGGQVLLRYHTTCVPLFTRQGKNLELLPLLRTLSETTSGDFDVWIKSPRDDSLIKGRIVAIRKTKEAIEKAKKKLKAYKRKKQVKQMKPETVAYAEYFIAFTTLNRHQYSAAELLSLYRLRWQIELSFKRLKSLLKFGHLPTRNTASSKAWLYGKMVIALLAESLHQEADFSPWGFPL